LSTKQAEIQKKKDAEASKYTFEIAECDLGSPAFMVALKATERCVPWSLGSRGRPVEIDIEQFGSLRASPDGVGAVIIDLHKALDAPLRMVSLVDDNSDEDVAEVPPKVDTDLTKTSKEARPGVALETVMECVPKEDEDRGAMVEDMQLSGKHITQDFMELGTILTNCNSPFSMF
jgi:hypothetical protein